MIAVVGEALIDLVAESDVRYAALPGGSPANVAVGLARLGHRTELLARISTNPFGQAIRTHMRANDVGLSYAVDATEPATLAVVTQKLEAEPQYSFYLDGTADWAWSDDELPTRLPSDTRALCTGSLALSIDPGASAIARLIERTRGDVTIIVDPNVRPGHTDPGRVATAIAAAHVVKLSAADVAWLAPGEPIQQVARQWLAAGPELVVVTSGAQGAVAFTAEGTRVAVPGIVVDVVDTIGAGDAFTAGLVGALGERNLIGPGAPLASIGELELRKIVERATLVAALTCTRPGADPPTSSEVASSAKR